MSESPTQQNFAKSRVSLQTLVVIGGSVLLEVPGSSLVFSNNFKKNKNKKRRNGESIFSILIRILVSGNLELYHGNVKCIIETSHVIHVSSYQVIEARTVT